MNHVRKPIKAERIKVAIIAPARAPFVTHGDSNFVDFGIAGVVLTPLSSRKGSAKNPPPTIGLWVRIKSNDIITEYNHQHILVLIPLMGIGTHELYYNRLRDCKKKRERL